MDKQRGRTMDEVAKGKLLGELNEAIMEKTKRVNN